MVKKVKKIPLSEYLRKGDLKKLIHFLKTRERMMRSRERYLQDKAADLELREAEMERKIEPIKYKEEELGRRGEDLRFGEEKLEKEIRNLIEKEKKTKMGTPKEKVKLIEELERLEEGIKAREEELRRREKYLNSREKEIAGELERLAEKKEEERKKERAVRRIKTGIPRLDDMLLGGVPFGSNVMIWGPPFTGKQILINRFVIEGIEKDIPCIIVTVEKPAAEIKAELRTYPLNYTEYEKNGLIKYIDIYSKRMDMACKESNVEYIKDINDLDIITMSINNLQDKLKQHSEYYRVVFPLSALLTNLKVYDVFRFLENLTGRCKRDNSVALYTLTKGIRSDTELQILRHLVDGLIEFKEENSKTYLRVQGVCEVQTRSWVQYHFTEREIKFGSFFLDHIR